VKRGFLRKLIKLLRERAIPQKYGCALALSAGVDIDAELLTEVSHVSVVLCFKGGLHVNN
jgi:hypothetical protein